MFEVMHIGLIGGIGPAATDYYYRRIITAYAARGCELNLTIVHADTPTLLDNLAHHRVDEQVAIYQRLCGRLVNAGAQTIAVTSIAGHFCIEAFKQSSPLPVVDLIEQVSHAVSALGLTRIGVLGTRTVMESGLYGAAIAAELVPPSGDMLAMVHQAYIEMAASGLVSADQREIFYRAARDLRESHNVDAIMLGGTDLALVFDEASSPFPLVDCAGIHADAIVAYAMASQEEPGS
jgi:aspartate racemase